MRFCLLKINKQKRISCMIKFYGNISEKNKNRIIKKEKFIFFLASLIAVIIGSIITIILSLKIDLLFLLFIIPLTFFLLIPLFPLSKKTINSIIPNLIIISDNKVICEGVNFKSFKQFSDIKNIVDYGDCYQIYFKWPNKSFRFICQKDLLVEGSIDEFEKLFNKKITHIKN